MNFFFNSPSFLYLLLVIPLLVLLYFISSSYNKKKAINFSNFEALERISGIEFFSKNFLVLFIDLLVVVFIILSMAQLSIEYNARTDSFSHIILMDNSKSMGVADLGDSRIEIGKKEAISFVDSMPLGVEFGVVSFAGSSTIIQKIDSSHLKTKSSLLSVSVSSIGGTVLLDAIILSDSLFLDNKKSILLISDGEFSFSNLSEVMRYINENNIVINTLLIGSEEGGFDESGGLHKINKDVMKALAFNSGGRFFEINSDSSSLDFDELFVETERNIRLDLTLYLLLAALSLFLIGWIFNTFRISLF